MRVSCCILAITAALASAALAQSPAKADDAVCAAERSAVERDMELARSKGQMLRRRQLAERLVALQGGCKAVSADQSRAANIERLEQEVRELREALDDAEEQLRKLKGAAR
ncbi:MAG: hypothetical protein JWP29_651 [Rhodoferax sp.]|nr:hypothetical protein [Rhodoferax sp.]